MRYGSASPETIKTGIRVFYRSFRHIAEKNVKLLTNRAEKGIIILVFCVRALCHTVSNHTLPTMLPPAPIGQVSTYQERKLLPRQSYGQKMQKEHSWKKGVRSKLFWAFASVVIAALTIWAVVSQSRCFTAEGFFIYLRSASPVWMICAALCMLCFIFSEAFAIVCLLRYFGFRSRLREGYVYSTADIFFSAITPSATGGQPASAFFMMRDGIPGTVTSVSLILNLALYAMSILIIGVIGAAVSPGLFFRMGGFSEGLIIFGIAAQIFLTFMFIMLLRRGAIIRRIGNGLILLLSKLHLLSRPEEKRQRLDSYVEHYSECAAMIRGNLRPLLPALAFNVLQRLSQIAVTVFVFLATGGAPERVGTVFSMQCYVILGSNCIPIPGAMGVSDYIMLDGLAAIGMSREAAISLDLLSRSFSFYICIIVCGISILCKYLSERGRINDRSL